MAELLELNKSTALRIVQIKGWQIRKRAGRLRPRIEALTSVASRSDQRWATDLYRVWVGKGGWLSLALVIDCYIRELLVCHLSRSDKVCTAQAAQEQALICRYGTVGRVREPFLLRSDNDAVFNSRACTLLVSSFGLKQKLITPHCPQRNGNMERMIRKLKKQCVHRHGFENLHNASQVISDWIY